MSKHQNKVSEVVEAKPHDLLVYRDNQIKNATGLGPLDFCIVYKQYVSLPLSLSLPFVSYLFLLFFHLLLSLLSLSFRPPPFLTLSLSLTTTTPSQTDFKMPLFPGSSRKPLLEPMVTSLLVLTTAVQRLSRPTSSRS